MPVAAQLINKKRGPSSFDPSSAAKKRRFDPMAPKYYAVRAGFKPGVYSTWPECQTQTIGFRGAQYKSFQTRQDAEAFVEGQNPSSRTEPDKFYAVAVGNPRGIYTDWEEAKVAITGVKGPKYKKFTTRQDAVTFIRLHGEYDDDDDDNYHDEPDYMPDGGNGDKQSGAVMPILSSSPPPRQPSFPSGAAMAERVLEVYTDGSSLANGRVGAIAGVGVFFGRGDPRNLSEPLDGEPQTNQRAELTAILRALQISPVGQHVMVITDSQYAINCVTVWAKSWEKKGWLTATGQQVKNRDLVQAIVARIGDRDRAGGRTSFKWVKGHDADPGNHAADRLAVLAARSSQAARGGL